MTRLGGLLVFLAYLTVAVAIFFVLPPGWRSNWGWYVPVLAVLGWCLIAYWFTDGQPFRDSRNAARERLKASVNPPYRHLGR